MILGSPIVQTAGFGLPIYLGSILSTYNVIENLSSGLDIMIGSLLPCSRIVKLPRSVLNAWLQSFV